jgi:hypothetical protein
MLSTDNQRISEIFERLAEIAAKTAELTSNLIYPCSKVGSM